MQIQIGFPLVILLALLGAAWIYRDATRREMETADMWAVGFAVAFLILPLLGGLIVLAAYLSKRNRRRGQPYRAPKL